MPRNCIALFAAAVCSMAATAQSARATAPMDTGAGKRIIEEVTVAATPLGGLEMALDRVPGNVQRATAEDLERLRTAGLAQFLDRRLGSVFINEAQSNPLQPDVQFRGFVASPLLGQPQGIAVYQDGVRINEPFGDVVAWALVPEGAIAQIDLIPGSNPVFGLNTLGGALSLRTKSGFTDVGTDGQLLAGSFGRVVAQIESGASSDDRLAYFASARYLNEDGWRQHSPSEALQLFGKVGWRDGTSSLDLSLTSITTELVGNGPVPIQLLEQQRDAIYTYPDHTENSLSFVTLAGSHQFTAQVELQGAAYFRRSDVDTLNGDESDFESCELAPGFVCNGEGEIALGPGGSSIPFSAAVDGAALNRSSTQQDTHGVSVQIGMTARPARRENRLIVGGSVDRSTVRFGSSTELGSFNDRRGAIPGGFLADEAFVDLDTRIENRSFFFTDTFAIAAQLDLTLAARHSDTHVVLRDRTGTALDGDHRYRRFNGAAGISYRAGSDLRFYANYSESNRAPSPVELTCADENAPCALPNAFLSDPPLQQVVAHTVETGADGSWRAMHWHLGLFQITNEDDILFVSAGALTNRGYFANVGETRRQGLEVNLNGQVLANRLHWFAHYTYLDAEFRHGLRVMSPHNPMASDGEIDVRRGARIPGVPQQLLKVGTDMLLTPSLTISFDVQHQSDQFLRGDEGNLTAPLAGFTVLNAGAEWRVSDRLVLFAQVDNLLDADYSTFGLFGAAGEALEEDFDDPRFVSPGAPLSAWLGFKWTL